MKKLQIFLVLTSLWLVACSKSVNDQTTTKDEPKPNFKMTDINIQIEPRISKGLHGDLTDVGFVIQDHPYHPLIRGRLDCSVDINSQVSCVGTANLATLANNAYRIIISTNEKPGKEALACDYFDYNKENLLNLVINPSSSGECILAQLEEDTGFSEDQLRVRIKHLLNADQVAMDIDLETTLYDLFRYYNQSSHEDWEKAWKLMVDAIKLDQPLPRKNKSTIGGAGRGF